MKAKPNPNPTIEAFLGTVLPRLLELLRRELQEYGQMLVLLQQQHDHVMARSAEQVLHSVAAINEQMSLLQQVRAQREALQKQIAVTLGPASEEQQDSGEAREAPPQTFEQLLPRLPTRFRVPVGTLVRENNDMLRRIQQRARQNHLLLSRSLEMMHQLIQAFMPADRPTTYDEQGQVKGAKPSPLALYHSSA